MLGPIAGGVYSYMSLIPIIQPPIMKLMTSRKERLIRMDYAAKPVSSRAVILFPIVVTIVIIPGHVASPDAAMHTVFAVSCRGQRVQLWSYMLSSHGEALNWEQARGRA